MQLLGNQVLILQSYGPRDQSVSLWQQLVVNEKFRFPEVLKNFLVISFGC